MMTVTKEVHFEAAHCLRREGLTQDENRDTYGACNHIHGHTYIMQVTVRRCDGCGGEGGLLSQGWVIDFRRLGDIIKQHVLNELDHAMMNDIRWLGDAVTTAEHMLHATAEKLKQPLYDAGCEIVNIRLYEGGNRTSWADYVPL